MKKEFIQSSCINFVNLLKQVRIRGHNKDGNKKNYVTTYNGFDKVSCFMSKLHKQMQQSRNELQLLPLNQPKRGGRMDYIVMLYKNLLKAKEKVEAPKINETLEKKFNYIYCGNETKLKRFPSKFIKGKHPSNTDYQNHKVHFMFQHHKQIIYHSIEEVKFMSSDIEAFNSLIQTNPYVSNMQNSNRESEAHPIYRCKTSLSVNQLAHLFDIIIDEISNQPVNKKELAQQLSILFETSKTKQPSHQQIYKAFYNVDDSTKEVVKNVVLKILRKVK